MNYAGVSVGMSQGVRSDGSAVTTEIGLAPDGR